MSTLFSDIFDGTFTIANDYDQLGGSWTIGSGILTHATEAQGNLFVKASHVGDITDCQVSITNVTGTGFDGGPVARWVTGDSCYYLDFVYSDTTITIYRRVTGGDSELVTYTSANFTRVASAPIKIKVTGTGATVAIETFYNGVSLGTYNDTNAARLVGAGAAGIISWSAGITFDNFLVEDTAAGAGSNTPSATPTNRGMFRGMNRHVTSG